MTKKEKGAELYILSLISKSSLAGKFFSNAGDVQVMKWYAHFFGAYRPKQDKEQKNRYIAKIETYLRTRNRYKKEMGTLLLRLSRCPKVVFENFLVREIARFRHLYAVSKDGGIKKYIAVLDGKTCTRSTYNEYSMSYEKNTSYLDREYTYQEMENICKEDNRKFLQALDNNKLEQHIPTRI